MNLKSDLARLLPDSLFVKSIAYTYRRFETEMAQVIAAFPMGGVALDVGAWYGPWSYWLSRRAAHVYAFEPNPDVAKVLEHAAAPNVTVRRMAVSDHAGTASLALPVGGKGTEGRASLEGLPESTRAVEVATVRLDDLGFEGVTLLKVDVEGHERAALAGAAELVAASHPLLVVELEERHGGIAPAVDLLGEWGYKGRVMVDGRWTSLDDFDLAAYQEEYLSQRGSATYLQTTFRRGSKYINNVVFSHALTSWNVD
jgi:FkbM family methyltransferase